jgi:ribosomal protein S12 methylthiotransferase accessory factor
MNIVIFNEESLIGKQIACSLESDEIATHGLVITWNPQFDALTALTPSLVVIVTDSPSHQYEQSILERCRKKGLRVLSVFGRSSTVLVGPFEVPGVPGCAKCAQLRWENSIRQTNLHKILQQQLGNSTDIHIPLTLSKTQLSSLGAIVATEIVAIARGNPTNSAGHVGLYRASGEFEWVPLVPSHECPRCNLRPDDGCQYGTLQFESSIVGDIDTLRVNTVDHESLTRRYVHQDVGYVSSVHTAHKDDAFVLASAVIQSTKLDCQIGYGSSFTDAQAIKAAILEVLERTCVIQSTSRRPTVYASYNSLHHDALHPSLLGMHDQSVDSSTNGYRQPFDEDKEYSWVWAYSTLTEKPTLILEQVAYYGRTADKGRFIYESSNGCSLGETLEEAVLHGICEVLERDGLMNMWYGQMPVPELFLAQDCPDSVRRYLDVLENDGYQARFFNISNDLYVPAVFAVAINKQECVPKIVTGSASHLNPYQALSSALRELMVQMMHLNGLSEERIQQGHAMVGDSSGIRQLLDHVVAAAMPEAYPRWRFLLEAERDQPLTVTEAYRDVQSRFQVESRDIRVILESVLQDLHQRGFDVIVVDQTNVEAAYGGFHAVKVIIPGMTPVTFGYGNQRLEGLTRVYELPYKMGYRSHILRKDELNPYCHPLS